MAMIDPIGWINHAGLFIFLATANRPRGAAPNRRKTTMTIRRTILAAVLALASIGPAAHAEGLKPAQGQNIDLGAVSGVAYYTVERDGFHVVATLAQEGQDGAPVRVEAVLAPDQGVVLSTPRGPGVRPDAVEISRRADTVLIRRAAVAAAD
jgi:hypothetical protein